MTGNFILVAEKNTGYSPIPTTSLELENIIPPRCTPFGNQTKHRPVLTKKLRRRIKRSKSKKFLHWGKKKFLCSMIFIGNFSFTERFLALAPSVRQQELTPNAKRFYKKLLRIKKVSKACKQKQLSVRRRLIMVDYYMRNGYWEVLYKLDPVAKYFFTAQLKHADNKNKRMIYCSEKDKLFAFALYKRSPLIYKFLSSLFNLPSVKILEKGVLNSSIRPGISKTVFDKMKIKVAKMKKRSQKCCILLLSEMSLRPNLSFNKFEDLIEGIVDNGTDRKCEVADHAQVWMLKSISVSDMWKQPVAFTYSKGTESTANTVTMFKNVVRKCQEIGLRVVACVTDLSANNSKAIRELIQETKADILLKDEDIEHDIIKIGNDVIIPLFDPPHLLKCFRNHMLTKNVKFSDDGIERVAKWSHIVDTYLLDSRTGKYRVMYKLTDYHVLPHKIHKLNVSKAAQVFSQKTAATVRLISSSRNPEFKISDGGLDTAIFLVFFNYLFDSVNGGIGAQPLLLRRMAPTQRKCVHLRIWNRALPFIKSISFIKVNSDQSEQLRPDVIRKWEVTLNGFKLLWLKLRKYGIFKFATRAFNLDALENFFELFRQRGAPNINPTADVFALQYKNILINNISRNHSKYSNCELDKSTGLLVRLKLVSHVDTAQNMSPPVIDLPFVPQNVMDSKIKPLKTCVLNYLGGFITKSVLPRVKFCNICTNNLLDEDTPGPQHVIVSREFGDKLYYNINFIATITKIVNTVEYLLSLYIHVRQISNTIKQIIREMKLFPIFECRHAHALNEILLTKIVNFLIFKYCKNINEIMMGKQVDPQSVDTFQQKAIHVWKNKYKLD